MVILIPLILTIINKFCVASVMGCYTGSATYETASADYAFISVDVFSSLKTL